MDKIIFKSKVGAKVGARASLPARAFEALREQARTRIALKLEFS
jgi:hypothetical protein